ncbi:hypothetical protein [Agrococcus sp. Marseille-Q4369]|uniref:hypothetical protein n=1 Tax=Agrococcus sp. Marseille-Q4369 TaxID=2810513 RepID=UPI001B8ADCD7|nr:hypothetical protein [Agrococcus sp. Marseille-Q4369]QUW18860.1 hypothetical protein JSQ78_00290 [Agrococcus sp. Marseille-Q4369]
MTRGTAQRVVGAEGVMDVDAIGRWREWLDRPKRREYRIVWSARRRLHYVWRGQDLIAITVTLRAARRAVDRDVLERVGYAA